MDESYVVELLTDGRPTEPGEVGEILVTDLNNFSVPLIRYRIGDLAVAVDESEAMIRRATRGLQLPNLRFRRGTVERLSVDGEFGFALSVLSFHHWEEPEAGLEAVHGALEPGGRFWIYEGDPEAPLEDLRRDQRPLWGWLRIPEGLVRKGLRGHGFTREEADRIVRPVVARTSFRTCEFARSGSTLRISLTRRAP